ncbi:MAG: NAD-dependent dehydratase, partial [Acidobacteriia bacterium]|nr:NAD-dependent dehydratase [Methyloceanibacter sp.]MBX5473382.1 NAD-dependent dehydratase [Acetobacteraceae bacterium]MCL6492321.1 NAD-dependent dehydratase [Terriglobia bacterium]
YILGGENYALADLFKEIAEIAGVRPPFLKLSEPVLWPVALVCEGLAYLANIPPLVTRDHLRMARKRLFFSSEKAKAELGYAPRPARTALADAIAWFRTVGMLGPAKQAA